MDLLALGVAPEERLLTASLKKWGIPAWSPARLYDNASPVKRCTSSPNRLNPFQPSESTSSAVIALQVTEALARLAGISDVEFVIKEGNEVPSGASLRSYARRQYSGPYTEVAPYLCGCLQDRVESKLGNTLEKHAQQECLINSRKSRRERRQWGHHYSGNILEYTHQYCSAFGY
jgi:hypothetical protein